jgi:hypothetical protein
VAAAPEGPERPDEPRVAGKPATGRGLLIAGGTTLGVGLVGLIAGLLVTRCDYDSALKCRYAESRDLVVPLAATAMLTGTILLGVGGGWRVRYRRWERWDPAQAGATALVPVVQRGGGGLHLIRRF